MKLNSNFITYDMAGELLIVPCGDASKNLNGFIRCNETCAFIVECLKEETTEEEILKKMTETYEGDAEVFAQNLKDVIEQLRSLGAIIE